FHLLRSIREDLVYLLAERHRLGRGHGSGDGSDQMSVHRFLPSRHPPATVIPHRQEHIFDRICQPSVERNQLSRRIREWYPREFSPILHVHRHITRHDLLFLPRGQRLDGATLRFFLNRRHRRWHNIFLLLFDRRQPPCNHTRFGCNRRNICLRFPVRVFEAELFKMTSHFRQLLFQSFDFLLFVRQLIVELGFESVIHRCSLFFPQHLLLLPFLPDRHVTPPVTSHPPSSVEVALLVTVDLAPLMTIVIPPSL
ncbi:unnamed protein product, partial [Ectocarpus sp. 4 AP-2014]